ncbi:RNA polymerase sigma-70 factor (ECF subfamily) [Chitinophaga dinghuensis]|uniref:RNA polymerase sigma-70 factor (ECF subfamily) n=1 Tax=Chitinophaga dinghuensis TaxID=1539050 RepID=A0A327VN89_9BACT|nr:sigma-70 family RNA polymerase sigma factor [Chitinophaga dinghuensis]RAJ76553.1 RNA polymerase sigma-70 factor (ECF subfamily) [Chitinophaga dinghuensis]
MTQYYQLLFPYAYNILGSAEDARDTVQEVLSKYYTSERAGIQDEKNYLIRSVINLAINYKNRNKRISRQPAEWLPEPIATDDTADKNVYLKDILSYSLMVLMERLPAIERAVFILKESFDYTHSDIAEVLSISEEYSRKLLSRAKTRLFKPEAAVRSKTQEADTKSLLMDYMDTIRRGDVARLEKMLSAEVALMVDGGGKINVVTKIAHGASEVARVLALVFDKYLQYADAAFHWINHQPALLFSKDGKLYSCLVFELGPDHSIQSINSVVDPDKLSLLSQQIQA